MKGFLARSELNIPLSIFRPGLGWWGWGTWPKDLLRSSTKWSPKTFDEILKSWEQKPNLLTFNSFELLGMTGMTTYIKVPGGQKHISTKWNVHWLTLTSVSNILRTVTSIRGKKGCFQEYLHFVLMNISLTMRNLDGFPQNVMISIWKSPSIFKEPGTFLLKYKYLFKNTQKESSSFLSFWGIPCAPQYLDSFTIPSHVEQLELFSTSAGEPILRPFHHEDMFSGLKWNRDWIFLFPFD